MSTSSCRIPPRVLAGGVTAVRDLAWPPGPDLPARRPVGVADVRGTPDPGGRARCSPHATATRRGRRWAPAGTGREVDGREDAAAIVGQLAAAGATAIKVSLNAEAGPDARRDGELAALCEAAHEAGAAGHRPRARGGARSSAPWGPASTSSRTRPWTHRLSEDVIAMAAARMRIVSTLDILSFGRDTPAIRTALDNLRRFHDAGGTVIYGTDLGNGADPAGHRRARAAACSARRACRTSRCWPR